MIFWSSDRQLLHQIANDIYAIRRDVADLKAKFGTMTKTEEEQLAANINKVSDRLDSLQKDPKNISNPHFRKE